MGKEMLNKTVSIRFVSDVILKIIGNVNKTLLTAFHLAKNNNNNTRKRRDSDTCVMYI